MVIYANGKPIELTGETILKCRECKGSIWVNFKTGEKECPTCQGKEAKGAR